MCGVFGWVLPSRRARDERTLVRLTDMLEHRGPDGSGHWLGRTADGQFQIGLGHRRLAIIDLSESGAQPMWSADRAIVVTFNGEIYNYVGLREELRGLGHTFRTASDTEVLIEAYRAWGDDALLRLRGMFAFALFDAARQRVLMARDPFGKKPLYIAAHDRSVLFSSEIGNLLEAPGLDRGIDWNALGDFLVDRYAPGPSTMFRAIRKLPPGSLAVWESGRFRVRRYFTPPFASVTPDVTNFEDATRMFEQAFDDAVRVRLRSDAPFGAYLSGGIDSSAVVGTMARHLSAPVRTFSVGFSAKGYSELDYARTIADLFKTDHHELVVSPDDYFAAWPEALLRRGAPVSEPADIPILLLSQAARSSVKMVLTGEGSDELLAGYPKHRAERWVGAYQAIVPSWIHNAAVGPAINALPYGMRRVKILTSALGQRNFPDRMRAWFGGVSPAERQDILDHPADTGMADGYRFSSKQGSALRRTLFYDQTSWLPDNLLERGDRMMMARSIEGRMPFMDTDLAAVVARFPDRFLVTHRRGKAVLRAAVGRMLPKHILERRKVGFSVPLGEWFRGPYRDTMCDLLASGQSETLRICNKDTIGRYVAEHMSGQQNHERVLWMLANLELFIRTFKPDLGSNVHRMSPAAVMPQHALSGA
jgi:asparagine synthase (glutamine-hydrolysing)